MTWCDVMKKRVQTGDLKLGMRVVELDRPWLDSPFLFQGFTITSAEDLASVQSVCKFVYVDDEDSSGAPETRRPLVTPVKKPVLPSKRSEATGYSGSTDTEDVISISDTTLIPRYVDVTPVEEELQQVIEIERTAREMVFSIFDDARLGHAVNMDTAKVIISEMVESAIRNPDAMVWVTQLRKKHEYTATHNLRVCMLALSLGRHLGYNREKLNALGIGSMLLDIGKIRVPNEILDKETPLTPEEFEIVKTHVPEGIKILENSSGTPPEALEIVGRHHEHYDGNGYVAGMAGDSIGEFGLITGIIDTYDAITSDRAYRKGISNVEALRGIYAKSGSLFHPWLTEQFIQCMGIYPVGSIVEMTNGEIGVVIAANRVRRLRPRVTMVLSSDGTPFKPLKDVDLIFSCDSRRQPYEIHKMLPAGAFGIEATDYMPVKR
jgi:HD-GYP domain